MLQKMSTGEFWSSLESMKSTLETGAANVVNSRAKFDAKISNAAPKRKRIEDAESSVPSRPVKRRSEVTQLLDSESEPIVKRRQPTSVPSPAPPKVMPWNQDHSKKKLAPAADTSITKKPKPKAAEIVSLSPQQQAILEVVMEGKNVFFTGSAGMYVILSTYPGLQLDEQELASLYFYAALSKVCAQNLSRARMLSLSPPLPVLQLAILVESRCTPLEALGLVQKMLPTWPKRSRGIRRPRRVGTEQRCS
jgi:hypothetical protein